MAVVVLNRETGKPELVSEGLAHKLVGEGTHAFRDRVSVVDEEGYQYTTGGDYATQSVRQGRAGLEDPGAISARRREHALEQQYGGFSGRGILEGVLRGGTLGLSDVALTGLGVDREGLEQRRERGTGTTLAELGGAILPGLVTGGAGAGASAARLLPAGRAAMAGARAAEVAGGGIRGLMVQGAAEGALFTAGQSVSDLALSDDPVTAEALVAEAGDIVSGVALGAGVGGALGLGGKFVKRIGERSKRIVNEADRAPAIETEIATRETSLAKKRIDYKDARFRASGSRDTVQTERRLKVQDLTDDIKARKLERRAARQTAKTEGAPTAESFKGSITRLEDEARAAHGKAKKLSRYGGDDPDGLQRAYDDFVEAESRYKALRGQGDDGLKLATESQFDDFYEAVANYEKATVKLGSAFREGQGLSGIVGDTLDDVYDDLVSPIHHLDRASDEGVSSLFAGKVGRPKALKPDPEIERMQAEIAGLKRSLISEPKTSLSPELAEMERGISKERLALQALKAARAGKPIDVDGLASILGDQAQDIASMAAQRGGSDSALLGLLSFVPGVGRVASVAQWMFGGSQRLAAGRMAFHRRVASAVDGLVKAKGAFAKAAPAAAVAGEAHHDRFKKRIQDLSWAMGNPDAFERRVWDNLAPVRALDLRLADQMIGVEQRKVAFLHAKAPKNPGIGNSLQQRDKWKPGAAEVARFLKMAEVVDDPVVAFDRAAKGKLTMDDVEALKTVYPEAYQAMRLELVARASELREELPYAKRVQLSIFFGVPVDSIMRPETVQAIQAAHQIEEGTEMTPSQETGQRGGNQKALNLAAVSRPEPTRAQGLVAA